MNPTLATVARTTARGLHHVTAGPEAETFVAHLTKRDPGPEGLLNAIREALDTSGLQFDHGESMACVAADDGHVLVAVRGRPDLHIVYLDGTREKITDDVDREEYAGDTPEVTVMGLTVRSFDRANVLRVEAGVRLLDLGTRDRAAQMLDKCRRLYQLSQRTIGA